MFRQLVAAWKRWRNGKPITDGLPPSTEERRVWVRYPCKVATTCQPDHALPETVQMTARVQDVSRGGINLIVDRELEAGRQLLIELPDTDLLPAAIIMANLMRVSEHQGGKWILGCTFATELADEDLAPFGAQLVRPDTADKRAWVRYPCNAPANCQIMRTGETEHFAGRAIDLSAGGIALEVDHYLEIGTTISVELRAANGKLTLSLLACVVRASVGPDNRWFLGCNFVRELADKELQAWLAASACRTPAHAVS